MKTIYAKFASKCQATGQQIKRGELIKYDPATRKAYKLDHAPTIGEQNQNEAEQISKFVQAQEEAYFDNFCSMNNI